MSLGWTSDTAKVHVDALCKTLEMKEYVRSEEFIDVSDVQVSQEYDQSEQQNRERANLDV